MTPTPRPLALVTDYDVVRWVFLGAAALGNYGASNDTWTTVDLTDPRIAAGSGSSAGAQVALGELWARGSVYCTGTHARYASTDTTTPVLVGVRGSRSELDYTGLGPPGFALQTRVALRSPTIEVYYSALDVTGSIYLQLGIVYPRRPELDPCR